MRSLSPKLYTRKYFLTQCGGFKEFLKGGIQKRLLYAYALADINKVMRVLDVGTGRGELAVKCAEAGAYVKAIDYSQAAIEIAKENLTNVDKEVAKRITFEKMNAKKISYPSKSFDVVFMIDVVEHLYPEELKQSFLEIKRLLKPGGKMIIHTPNAWLINSMYFFAKIFFKWKKQDVHVNEQSFFSLHRGLRLFDGKARIFFRKRKGYFSGALYNVKTLPSWTAGLAKLLDKIYENKIVSFFIYHTPLVSFLGSDLWAIVEIPRKEAAEDAN